MSMMNKSVGILGTGSYAPDHVVTNFDLEKTPLINGFASVLVSRNGGLRQTT